jgi:predicted RNA-binding protein with PUA-like domain
VSYWLFQANRSRYDVLADLERGGPSTWNISHRRAELAIGDGVLIWLSGPEAGVYARGRIVEPPTRQEDFHPDLWTDPTDLGDDVWRCVVAYDEILAHPIRRADLAKEEAFAESEILRRPRSRNPFRVTDEAWDAVTRRIADGLAVETSPARRTGGSPDEVDLEPGRVYSWDELGAVFSFKPDYLSVTGGMPVSWS